MSRRDIDTVSVINEVRKKKCLWDASDLLYKNRHARNKAWDDIVVTLFEDVSEEKKQLLEKHIQQRWKTARDAFLRSKTAMKNTRSGSSAKKFKKYVFYDELSFLIPLEVNEVEETNSKSSPPENAANTECAPSDIPVNNTKTLLASPNTLEEDIQAYFTKAASSTLKMKNKPRQTNQENIEFEKKLLTLLGNQRPDIANDDLAFFFSLGPILKIFNLEQKMEFRSRVMRDAIEVKNMHNRLSSSASTINKTSSKVKSRP